MARVPKAVKDLVWIKYMGNKQEGKCYCCNVRTISSLSFEAGHVVSVKNNGPTTPENLRPICRTCNSSMGEKNLEEFRKEHFPSTAKRNSKKKNTPKNEIDKYDKWLGF